MNVKYFVALLLLLSLINVSGQKKITLDDIYKNGTFRQNNVEGLVTTRDGKHYTVLEDDRTIVKYEYENGEKKEVLFSLDLQKIDSVSSIVSYEFSEDESQILLTVDPDYIYRYSYVAYNYIYEITTHSIKPVFHKKLQMAKLSPDGNQVAFVFGNNLYIKNTKSSEIKQLTFDGRHGSIIYGMPDWVYEEEFSLTSGFEWSPDSKNLAFYRFDESRVKEYQIEEYYDLYPSHYRYKYPKAGEENSVVSVHVYNLSSKSEHVMNTGNETDIYFPRIKWTSTPNLLCVVRLNRLQNKADLLLCNALDGNSNVFYTETDKNFISEFTDDFASFVSNSDDVIILSGKDGFLHLYRFNMNGDLINRITNGKWEVDNVLSIDEKNKLIYYTSTEVSPLERHIYKISFDGSNKQKISNEKGCNLAEFSSSHDYYINFHSSANKPLSVKIYNNSGKIIRVLEENSGLLGKMQEFNFSKQEFFSFVGPGRQELYGYMIKPANFDSLTKYPLLVYVYGGPESQDVIDEWNGMQAWFQLLTQNGYVVACIDNRGTDGRGEEFKKLTYLQLGKYETEDQIVGAKYLGSLSYIDENRIGIFGWSYGGYMSLLCIMKSDGLFKMGIAVAPVTNWRFYDTIYTERFLRKPQDNPSGYDDNSPLNFADDLKGKLLLVHGTSDDNVHFQNSLMMADELVKSNKQFEMQFYPNKNHSIYGGNTRIHLFTRMTEFIFNNL